MSTNPKQCPYLVEVTLGKISCKGFSPGTVIGQGFSSRGDKCSYYAEYCTGNYHFCSVAAMLNAVFKQYDDSPCPYNSSVPCLFKEDCGRCGWNPAVSLERLKQQFPWCSPECLEMLLTENEAPKCCTGGSDAND